MVTGEKFGNIQAQLSQAREPIMHVSAFNILAHFSRRNVLHPLILIGSHFLRLC
jgi:hypothetical protein